MSDPGHECRVGERMVGLRDGCGVGEGMVGLRDGCGMGEGMVELRDGCGVDGKGSGVGTTRRVATSGRPAGVMLGFGLSVVLGF